MKNGHWRKECDATSAFGEQNLAVQKVDNAIQRKKNYPEDSSIGFCNIYPLDSGLSGEERYPTFEQPEPEVVNNKGEAL